MTDSPLQGSVVHQDPADGHGDPDLTRALEAFAPGPRELVSDLLARLATARQATAPGVHASPLSDQVAHPWAG